MLYQVKQFRLISATRVGLLGGFLTGLLGGLFFLPVLYVGKYIGNLLWYGIQPSIPYIMDRIDSVFPKTAVYAVWFTVFGAIGGAIAGAIIMSILGFYYNRTLHYTGGLMVELESRGKLKEKARTSASPQLLEEIPGDEISPSESEVHADRSSEIQHRSL